MLRSQGWIFNRLAVILGVSKPTLIKWSRQHQFDIQNLRVTETEAIAEKLFKPRHQRWETIARDLARIEEEMGNRRTASRSWPKTPRPSRFPKTPTRSLG